MSINAFLINTIMKKQILNIGKALNKAEQKQVNGGTMLASCADLYKGLNCNGYVIRRCREYCEQ